jgi:cephalosporin hydroxylase
MAKQISLSALVVCLVALNLYQFARQPAPAAAEATAQAKDDTAQKSPSAKDREIADRYHEWFYANVESTWGGSKWLGVTAAQNPNDVWIHQEIITEVKPDFIVEAGTMSGGSALIWGMVLQQVNPQGRVITIDIDDGNLKLEGAMNVPIWKERIEFIKGSSTDPKIVAELAKRVQGRKVLVILDSDHSKKHVLEELKAYSPMVPVGSYLIVQDTNINGHPVLKDFGPGPYEAVEEFLATNKQFEIDKKRERFLFTMHPNGYLKRVK